MSGWTGGLAEWIEGDTTFLSVAFTWRIDDAIARARFARACGMKVKAGGPALFLPQNRRELEKIAEVSGIGHYPEAVTKHNPMATFATRGCPKDCSFCIVPRIEGRTMIPIPNFIPRPILSDNNLSAIDPKFQQYIIDRYREFKVPLLDAQSGFDPETFTPDVYERWRPLIRAGDGPWRFAYDEMLGEKGMVERREVLRVMKMLHSERSRNKRVYVLIGNEPVAECMQRIYEVLEHGCEPHVQPLMKLNARDREPHVRGDLDWTADLLRDVARWANRKVWRKAPRFEEYDRTTRREPERYDAQQGLFA